MGPPDDCMASEPISFSHFLCHECCRLKFGRGALNICPVVHVHSEQCMQELAFPQFWSTRLTKTEGAINLHVTAHVTRPFLAAQWWHFSEVVCLARRARIRAMPAVAHQSDEQGPEQAPGAISLPPAAHVARHLPVSHNRGLATAQIAHTFSQVHGRKSIRACQVVG